jgi:hypothetical protein
VHDREVIERVARTKGAQRAAILEVGTWRSSLSTIWDLLERSCAEALAEGLVDPTDGNRRAKAAVHLAVDLKVAEVQLTAVTFPEVVDPMMSALVVALQTARSVLVSWPEVECPDRRVLHGLELCVLALRGRGRDVRAAIETEVERLADQTS